MSERTRFLESDAHKATIAVAVAEDAGLAETWGTIANDPTAVRKLAVRLGGQDVRLVAAYEAGPTGFALHRQLVGLGVECLVIAPSHTPVRPGDRVKTDRARCAQVGTPAAQRRPDCDLGPDTCA
jgi:transposase